MTPQEQMRRRGGWLKTLWRDFTVKREMRVLLFYTSHRHKEEIKLSGLFLGNTTFLKECDVAVHCNNPKSNYLKLKKYSKFFPNENKKLIYTIKNSGYSYGHFEALADNFQEFQYYDYVIHLHPDVYIVDENPILNILNKYKDRPEVSLICNKESSVIDRINTDLFIFKPKLLTFNLFKLWEKIKEEIPVEEWFFKMVNDNNVAYVYEDRYESDTEEQWGTWHEHKLSYVIKYFKYKYDIRNKIKTNHGKN